MMIAKIIKYVGYPRMWFRDELMLRLMKNASVLFGGNTIASLLGLVSLALTARGLGTEGFGILVMITTYVLIVDQLVNFQSWQAIIKYGSDALEQKRDDDFKALIKFGFLIDGVTAALGAIIAASASWFVGHGRGWNQEYVIMAALYSFTILFHINGTPTAILRLFNKFKSISVQYAISATIKVVGVCFAFLMKADIWGFLIVWAIADIAGKIILILMSLRELKTKGFNNFLTIKSKDRVAARFKGLWGFVWTTNINSSIRLTSREADIMIIAALLGPAMVGLYKIAKQFSSIIMQLIDPLYQAVFPELAKLYAKNNIKQFVLFGVRASIIAGFFASGVWVFFLLFSEHIIRIIVGVAFLEARGVLLWYMAAIVIAAVGFPLQPAMLSMGRPKTTFWVHIGSTVVYFLVLYFFLTSMSLIGAGIAYVIYYAVWVLTMLIIEMIILAPKKVKN